MASLGTKAAYGSQTAEDTKETTKKKMNAKKRAAKKRKQELMKTLQSLKVSDEAEEDE
jgi:hypothetical protein